VHEFHSKRQFRSGIISLLRRTDATEKIHVDTVDLVQVYYGYHYYLLAFSSRDREGGRSCANVRC